MSECTENLPYLLGKAHNYSPEGPLEGGEEGGAG